MLYKLLLDIEIEIKSFYRSEPITPCIHQQQPPPSNIGGVTGVCPCVAAASISQQQQQIHSIGGSFGGSQQLYGGGGGGLSRGGSGFGLDSIYHQPGEYCPSAAAASAASATTCHPSPL